MNFNSGKFKGKISSDELVSKELLRTNGDGELEGTTLQSVGGITDTERDKLVNVPSDTNSELDDIRSDITDNTTDIATNETNIATNVSDIVALDERVTVNEEDIENLPETKILHRFYETDKGTLDYDETINTFSITPDTSGIVRYIFQGVAKSFSTTKSVVVTLPTEPTLYYFLINSNDDLVYTNIFNYTTLLSSNVYVAKIIIDENGVATLPEDQRHTNAVSAKYIEQDDKRKQSNISSGLTCSGFDADGSGNDDSSAQYIVDAGIFLDADLTFNSTASTTERQVFYIDTNGKLVPVPPQYLVSGFSVAKSVGGRLMYNNTSVGTLLEITNNDFVLMHEFVYQNFNGTNFHFAVVGFNDYNTLNNARDGASVELEDFLSALVIAKGGDVNAVATTIYQTSSTYNNQVQARVRSIDGADKYYISWIGGITGTGSASGGGDVQTVGGIAPVNGNVPLQINDVTAESDGTYLVNAVNTPMSNTDATTIAEKFDEKQDLVTAGFGINIDVSSVIAFSASSQYFANDLIIPNNQETNKLFVFNGDGGSGSELTLPPISSLPENWQTSISNKATASVFLNVVKDPNDNQLVGWTDIPLVVGNSCFLRKVGNTFAVYGQNVYTVANVSPDASGNYDITASEVNAQSKTPTTELISVSDNTGIQVTGDAFAPLSVISDFLKNAFSKFFLNTIAIRETTYSSTEYVRVGYFAYGASASNSFSFVAEINDTYIGTNIKKTKKYNLGFRTGLGFYVILENGNEISDDDNKLFCTLDTGNNFVEIWYKRRAFSNGSITIKNNVDVTLIPTDTQAPQTAIPTNIVEASYTDIAVSNITLDDLKDTAVLGIDENGLAYDNSDVLDGYSGLCNNVNGATGTIRWRLTNGILYLNGTGILTNMSSYWSFNISTYLASGYSSRFLAGGIGDSTTSDHFTLTLDLSNSQNSTIGRTSIIDPLTASQYINMAININHLLS